MPAALCSVVALDGAPLCRVGLQKMGAHAGGAGGFIIALLAPTCTGFATANGLVSFPIPTNYRGRYRSADFLRGRPLTTSQPLCPSL